MSDRRRYRAWIITLLSLLLLLAASLMLGLCIGETTVSPAEVIRCLMSNDPDDTPAYVMRHLRLSRVLLGGAVGGVLGLAGVILQGIFRNPLVEPYTLGISGGASVGVSLAIVFSLRTVWEGLALPLAGFAGALATVFLVYGLGTRRGEMRVERLLLTGVMVSFISSSIVMLLMATTSNMNLQGIIFWIMGSLNETDETLTRLLMITSLASLALTYPYAPALNATRLGMEPAAQLGVNTTRVVKALFLIASLLTGVCVSVVGLIGFVGLIIPRLAHVLVGSDFRVLLPASFLGGASFLVLSDIVARSVIAPLELPIGVITGIVGGTIFIAIAGIGKTRVSS
ncbi:MAG: iron ABC transporter permease [Odoribacteraceae bacterium]|jgi:iron complex transport system permease protein|nr:iron ABC transporter permease [Odoribacteraceae bacterium]